MTLGTGIFSSTVLVLLAIAIWQITARHKWKLAGKIAAGFVVVCAVIGFGLYAWNYIANLPPAPSVVTELAGVKLGMSPTDVTLALGKPDVAGEPKIKNKETRIDYVYSDPQVDISFYGLDKYTTKVSSICTSVVYTTLLGFDNYSSEVSVIDRLGKPDQTSIAKDGLSKIISYPKWNVAFTISKGAVSEKCISRSGLEFTAELLSPEAQKAADQKAAVEAKLAAEAGLAAQAKAIAEAQRAAAGQRAAAEQRVAAEAQRAEAQRAAAEQHFAELERIAAEQRAAEQRAAEQRFAESERIAVARREVNVPQVEKDFVAGDKFPRDAETRFYGGGKYIGQMRDGRRNGLGVYVGPDRIIYRGGWRADMRNGLGVCIYPDGKRIRGLFRDGTGPC